MIFNRGILALVALSCGSVVGAAPLEQPAHVEAAIKYATDLLRVDAVTAEALSYMTGNYTEMMEALLPVDTDCNAPMVRPEITECHDYGQAMISFLGMVEYDACHGASKEELASMVSTLVMKCANFDTMEGRNLQETSPAFAQQCVQRFREGNFEGVVPPAAPFEELSGGGINQYGWATNFNRQFNIGLVIHSTGAPNALQGLSSTPTFILRNGESEVIFRGVAAAPDGESSPPNFGLRGAVVADFNQGTNIVTVVAASVEIEFGEFLTYELDLNAYASGEIVQDIKPVRRVPFQSPSVRATELISEDIILFAPLFDINGGFGRAFLQLYNWKTGVIFDTEFELTDDRGKFFEPTLTGLVWDFECFFENPTNFDGGLCWINTIEFNDPLPFIPLIDGSVDAILSYFPLSEIAQFTSNPGSLPPIVRISTTVVDTDFDLEYSAQSIEPIGEEAGVICTLSGFLFRIGSLALAAVRRRELQSINFGFLSTLLPIFELGDPQECNLCRGNEEFKAAQFPIFSFFGRLIFNVQPQFRGECSKLELQGQKSSTAYVWAVEECGGKVFAATYDIASVLALLLLAVQNQVVARFICSIQSPANLSECVAEQIAASQDFLNNNRNILVQQQATLANQVFGSNITPDDLGFDLYFAEISDLLSGATTQLMPLTFNGFREISPALGPTPANNLGFPFSFAPDSQEDAAVRNMICQKSKDGSKPDTLILASAVFEPGQSSNTFEVNTDFEGCLNADI